MFLLIFSDVKNKIIWFISSLYSHPIWVYSVIFIRHFSSSEDFDRKLSWVVLQFCRLLKYNTGSVSTNCIKDCEKNMTWAVNWNPNYLHWCFSAKARPCPSSIRFSRGYPVKRFVNSYIAHLFTSLHTMEKNETFFDVNKATNIDLISFRIAILYVESIWNFQLNLSSAMKII